MSNEPDAFDTVAYLKLVSPQSRIVHISLKTQVLFSRQRPLARADATLIVAQRADAFCCQAFGQQLIDVAAQIERRIAISIRRTGTSNEQCGGLSRGDQRSKQRTSRRLQTNRICMRRRIKRHGTMVTHARAAAGLIGMPLTRGNPRSPGFLSRPFSLSTISLPR